MTVIAAYLCAVVPTPAATIALLPLSTQDLLCTTATGLCLVTVKEHRTSTGSSCSMPVAAFAMTVLVVFLLQLQQANLPIVKQPLLFGHQRQRFAPRVRPINVAQTQ